MTLWSDEFPAFGLVSIGFSSFSCSDSICIPKTRPFWARFCVCYLACQMYRSLHFPENLFAVGEEEYKYVTRSPAEEQHTQERENSRPILTVRMISDQLIGNKTALGYEEELSWHNQKWLSRRKAKPLFQCWEWAWLALRAIQAWWE